MDCELYRSELERSKMSQKLPEWLGKKRIYNKNFVDIEKEIIKWDVLSINDKQHIKVRFLSVNSENRQGIRIAIDAGKGMLITNGVTARAFKLWEDECPKEFEIECISDEGFISVYNIFEKIDWTGMKNVYSQMYYSGMILEKKGNVYQYKCNNAQLMDDFDKLVFEIEIL